MTIDPLELIEIKVINIRRHVKFVLIQAHQQTNSLCLRLFDPKNHELEPGNFVRGKDIGLVVNLESNETSAHVWLENEISVKLQVLIQVTLHTSEGK